VSANAIANVEVLATFAIVVVVAIAIAWPFVRWHTRMRRIGHQSPFVMLGLVGAYFAALGSGLAAGVLRSGICWSCTPAGNPEEYRQELIWPHVSGFAISFILVTLVGTAIAGLIVRSFPAGTRRAGIRHARFPWRGLARVALACLVPLPVLFWQGVLTASSTYRVAQFLVLLWAGSAGLARRSRSRTLEEVVAEDRRPAVVYLRAFDGEEAPFASVKTEDCRAWGIPVANPIVLRQSATLEQFLGPAVNRYLGPFVALGDPNDYLPPEGAARVYLGDDHWKEVFEELARASACLLLAVGRSDNLRWELESMRRWNLQHKLFVVTSPPAAWRWTARFGRRATEQQWTAFAADLAFCGLEAAAFPGAGATITFDDRGSAVVAGRGAKTPEQFVMAIEWALRATTI
jgi:hypothetical protein